MGRCTGITSFPHCILRFAPHTCSAWCLLCSVSGTFAEVNHEPRGLSVVCCTTSLFPTMWLFCGLYKDKPAAQRWCCQTLDLIRNVASWRNQQAYSGCWKNLNYQAGLLPRRLNCTPSWKHRHSRFNSAQVTNLVISRNSLSGPVTAFWVNVRELLSRIYLIKKKDEGWD